MHEKHMGEVKKSQKILVEKPKRKRPFGSPRKKCMMVILNWMLE
jgi:hypothetical protein